MLPKNSSLKPRKKPVQQRSAQTVDIIFEATIQVLLALGPEKLTTTKVAERAGVSVGTLYQYFGDKQSLLASVLEHYLLGITEAVESACDANLGAPLEVMTKEVINAFFVAKFSHSEASKALYSIASDLEGSQMVLTLMQRTQAAICSLLSSASDAKFSDPITATFVISTAMTGPVQALLTSKAPSEYQNKICQEVSKMAYLYLREIADEK